MAGEVIDLLLRARMEASGVEAGVGQIQKSLKGLTLPKGVTAELEKSFGKLTPLLKEYQKQLNKGFSNKKDLQNFNALKDKISETFSEIRSQVQSVNSQNVRLKVDTQEIDKLENKITAKSADLQKALDNVFTKSVNSSNITDQLNKVIGNTSKASTIKPMADMAKQLFNTQDYAAYNNKIDELRNKILSLKTTKIDLATALGVKDAEHNLDAVDKKVETFFNNLKVNEGKVQTIEHLKQELKDLGINLENVKLESLGRGAGELKDIDSLISQLSGSLRETGEAASEAGNGMVRMVDEVNQLKTSTQYFFSLRNMLNLFKRGVKEAYEAVKELDAAMTETAVVTDFNVGDMWEKLPEYTANANALGASVKDMYEATTLYYQQGLNTEQAMGIANETMKMARIGGLEAADATDKMTAALRGFNMEINETSAQRVNDVYSNLAAKTASNTEELGTAMQRTASIAASAGMSFEGTAAFLAQAIETTREPAENLGTAMKTIVARFTELKKNPLEITEVDGEEVDYNKVDTALKSIGVSLKDANGQFRNLDQVFLDISQRWDSLTQTQQRYVATQAAGSRQQSRFIAMMSNYDRTVQLMDYANNSAGASNEQFGKTMESLEAKLNKLHNAWQQFEMGIANNAIIKTFVDGLTGFLNITNKIIDKLSQGSGVVKSFLSLFTAFAGLKGFSRLANIGLGGLAGAIDPNSSMREGLKSGLSGFKGNSQARAITNPIVAAIHGLIPHIDKAAQGDIPYKYQANGSYKEARAQLTSSLAKNKNSYSVGGVLDIFDANKLNKQQQKDFFQSSPGLKRNITKSLSNLFTEVGMDPKVSKGLIQGFSAGDFALDEVLASKSLSPEQVAKIMAPSDPQQAVKYVEDQYAKIQTQAMHDVATMNLSPEEEASAIEGLTEQRWKAATEAIPVDKIKAFKQATQDLSSTEKFANTIGKVGAGLTSAGYSMQMFGAEISKVNPLLGETISNMGGLLTTAGSLANILPSILSNPLALAGVAIVGAIAFDKYQSEKIKQTAEEVVNTYKDTTKEITEKVESLKSAQSVFDELGRGVDRYGNNINLAAEDYSKYLETVDDVAEMAPELIRGYDAQGHAILATGSAIDELITKQEELKKSAVDTFIDDSSINSLVAGIQESDAFKKAANTKKGDNYGYLTKSTDKIYETLANAGVQNFDKISKQLFGKEINLLEPSNEDLRILSEHYNDIINLIESENQNLTDKQKETLETAFSDLGSGWKDMTAEIQPLSQAIGQYLSSEGLDTIGLNLGEEFTASFNQGLESLSMTAAIERWDSSRIKEEASNYAQGFKDMTKEGSEYAKIMEQVTAEQEKYNDSIGNPGAIEAYEGAVEDYASQLEELANKYDDGTAAGQLFANTLRETANSVRNYATESVVDLGQALNTLSDEFASARGAEERFKKATENGDYYTAAEGYKSIIDTVLDEKNVAGNGSIAGWTGAEEILGTKFVDSHNWDQVVDRIKSIAPMFEDGISGVQKFGDFLVEAAGESGKELKGLGEVIDGQFHFDFDLEEGELEQFADKLGISTDALSALIDKSRQFVAWNTSDMPQVRQALEQSGQSMVGQNGRLYTSESSFRAEAKQQGIFGDDYTKTKNDLQKEQNVEFLTVKSLTAKDGDGFGLDKVLSNIGLTGADKNLNNTVAALSKMGFELEDQKKILTSQGIKLADGAVSEEDIANAYNEQAYALENPTVAGIANDTGVIANAATAMLASMGILTDDAKQKIDQSTSDDAIKGIIHSLRPEGGFKSTAEHDAAINQVQSQIADYESTINLLKQSGNEALAPQIEQLENARNQLQSALDQDMDSWQTKLEGAQSYVEGIGQTVQEQQFLDAHAIDIQGALASSDPTALVTTLQQLQQEGNLSTQTMLDLATSLSQLDGSETYLSALNALMSNYYEQVKAARDETYQPFTITTKLQGDDLNNYISSIDNLTSEEHKILVDTELYGDEKVSAFLDEINNGFDGGNETTKTVLIEATAKLANGDTAGANELLQKSFGDQAQEVKSKLDIICDGSIANESEVKQAIQSQIDSLPIEKQIEVTANVKATYTGQAPQGGNITYNASVNTKAIDDAKTKANNTTGTMTVDADTSKAQNKIDNLRNIKDASITVNAKKGTGWTQTMSVNVQEHARGRNYSIPAHQSLSFGAAAEGLNIPKKQHPSGKKITSLVGEEGFEIGYIPSEQRSVIFGANGPEMTAFPKDTVIYPHSQSKKILQRGKGNHKSFNSFAGGNTGSSGGIPTSNFSSSSASSALINTAKKTGDSLSRTAEDTSKAVARVLVWWDNAARRATAIQRKADKNQSTYEKYLKEIQATLKTTGTTGQGDNFIANTQKAITEYERQFNRATNELKTIDTGSAAKTAKARKKQYQQGADNIVEVSYKSGKKQKTAYMNTAGYIKYDKNSGSYQIDENALKKIKNTDQRKAFYEAAKKELDDRISKKNAAEDNIKKAQEALEKFSEELYKTFFAWENELTQIWNITQKIEQAQKRISNIDAFDSLLNARIGSGRMQAGSESKQLAVDNFRNKIEEQQKILEERREAIEQSQKDLKNALSADDEQTILNSVNAKLDANKTYDQKQAQVDAAKAAQKAYDAASADKTNKTNTLNSVQAQIKKLEKKKKKKSLSKKEKTQLKNLKEQRTTLQKQIAADNNTMVYNKDIAAKLPTLQNELSKLSGNLNETEKLGYEAYKKELENRIAVIAKAQSFGKVTHRADGTIDIEFKTEEFEEARLNGSLTEDMAKAIQDYWKDAVELRDKLIESYEELTKSVEEFYTSLKDLKDQAADYSEQLVNITEEAEKKKIDDLKKLSSSLKDALDRLYKEVKNKLDARRQQEDNASTERDISQKQQRLAALRADTSGGHQVEIAQLEKEIAEQQQNYQRTLEDQLLDRLQQQADLAAEQRERQIELEEQIAQTVTNIALVNEWMRNPEAYEDQMREAYYKANNYDTSTELTQDKIARDFESLYQGILTNKEEQNIVSAAIDSLEAKIDETETVLEQINKALGAEVVENEEDSVVEQIEQAQKAKEITLAEAKANNMSLKEAQSKFTSASFKDLKNTGKYSAQEFRQANISYANAKSAGFTLEQLKAAGYTEAGTEIDKQNKNNTYVAAMQAVKKKKPEKVKSSDIDDLFTKGSAAGYGKASVLKHLVGGFGGSDPFTWKNIFRAIIDAKGINRYNLVKTWPSGDGTLAKALATLGRPNTYVDIKKHKNYKSATALKFKTGGLADYTGPAWLDGTPSKPELVLNATDTKNFLALRDVLSSAMKSTGAVNNSYSGDTMYEININVDHLNNDYDVDKVAERVKKIIVKDAGYRNVTQVRNLR